ncbi:MAG: ABC transporter permease subunit, partial [Candidatus Thermoplasmatota archaeon]|nr:ABC transporter permease subunit [Candidatus Thermoplasmatota archaeon]
MSDLQRILNVASRIRRERLAGIRLKIMMPILLLFLPGMAWGFSDPNIVLPGGHRPDTAMEVLFYASLGVVFGATMCAVLMAFDGVSKDRASGMLEVRLAQPMPRRHQATALILGHAQSILLPVYALLAAAVVLVRLRMGEWPSASELLVYGASTGLIVLWYTLFALLASTSAREQGTAIAFGIGVWFFFTFLWALVTTMVAYASGVAVGEANDPAWVALEGLLDLLSPNGVYHHLLETQLPTVDRGVAAWQ